MKEKAKIIIVSICSLLAVGFDYVKYLDSDEIFKGLSNCLRLGYLGTLILFILLIYLYKKKEPIKHWIINVLSLLLSFFMVFGASYMKYGTSILVFADLYKFFICLLVFIGYYYVFKVGISYLFSYIDKIKIKEYSNKVINFYKKHPFIISLIIIILCWIPYFIAYYPVILSPDPSFQIKQFFGIRTKYADYAVLLDENVVLTNHHPVFHTVLIGGCLKIGHLMGNDNLGLFLYTLLQTIILSSILAYSIKYMLKDMKLPSIVGIISLIIYAVIPMYGVYAISGVKDVLFSAFMLLYVILLHKFLSYDKDKIKLFDLFIMGIVLIMLVLFRNNGIHVIILSFPFLIIALKKYYKQLLILFIIVLALSFSYSKILLPYLKITPGSIRETLSIPFQQTARYVLYYGDELSDDDALKIDKVLGIDTLAQRYNPELSDPVKNEYNKYATKNDLMNYFKVWFNGLVKHPMVYIDATINNVYGFFYPEKTSWYLHTNFDNRIVADGFDYHYNDKEEYREDVSDYVNNFPLIPILGLFVNIGFSTWIVFILVGYWIHKKNYKKIVLYLPALISILVCIAGPANTYFRYAMPYMFSLPILISFILEKKKV